MFVLLMLLLMLHSNEMYIYRFTDCAVDGECESCCGSFSFEDKEFTVKRGDYASLMEKVSCSLKQAEVSARDAERNTVSV